MLAGRIEPSVYYFTNPKLWITTGWAVAKAVLIVGYPGIGRTAEVTVRFLARSFRAKRIGTITSPYFSTQAVVDKRGRARLLGVQIFLKNRKEGDVMIALGEQHQELMGGELEASRILLKFFKKIGGDLVIAVGGHVEQPKAENRVYALVTDPSMLEYAKNLELELAPTGTPIVGSVGITLGLCRLLGIRGMGLLGLTNVGGPDLESSRQVLEKMDKLLNANLDFSLFESETQKWKELQEKYRRELKRLENDRALSSLFRGPGSPEYLG